MCKGVWSGTTLWFSVGSKLRRCWLWQQCFINPFLTVSAVSCLNMNGMIGTSHTSGSKESLSSPLFLHCSLFLLFTPSRKSKSRLGFNDGRSWSLGQTPIAAGGAASPARYLPPLRIVPDQLGTSPHPVWPGATPKHRGCYC